MEIRSALPFLLLPLTCARPHSPPSAARAPADAAAFSASADDLPAADRRPLLDQIGRELEAHYVFPDVAARMVSALGERASRGAYDDVHTNSDFASAVSADMREVSHDRHAMLEHTPPPEQASAEEAEWNRLQAGNRATAGFGATERLPGNVAHLVIKSFESGPSVRDAVTRRFSEVADADALIVDLRENSGGDPATVAFMASYLFDPPKVHLNDLFWRDDNSTETFWTTPDLPGRRFGKTKPVLVLTSKHTFSAGEELAYDLQCLHRARIVGEPTAGGAHPVEVLKLSALLTLRVPTGRAINPVTKTDWEGVGVKPDVEIEAASSLHEAHVRALRAILTTAHLPATRRRTVEAALEADGG